MAENPDLFQQLLTIISEGEDQRVGCGVDLAQR